MPTRREFCRSAAGAAAALALMSTSHAHPEAAETPEAYAADRPLLDLQQEFLDLRFGMFLHFNMATFQDREWGDPLGPTEAFDPAHLDTDQWARAAKSAGMTYGCLTTKHHDGFCIWPTKTKSDSILQTPKKLDVVRAYADSFRKAGLKVGLYYSILDLRGDIRHHNVTREKIDRIKAQLTEILTNYGEINLLIFDGWDAPWSRIPYDEVPFVEIYAHVKRLQPNILICELNASEYPGTALYYTDLKAIEQNAGQRLADDSEVPAISCVTLTDGWFWKRSDEDAELKSVDTVVNEWLIPLNNRHCNLILNAAPNRDGRFSPNMLARLEEIGKAWRHGGPMPKIAPSVVITTPNLATGRPIRANSSPDTLGPDMANDGKFGNSWCPDYGQRDGWLEVTLDGERTFNTLVLVEPVGRFDDYKESRIKGYAFQRWNGTGWTDLVRGTNPKRVQIHAIPKTKASRVRLLLEGHRDMPHIAEIGIYNEPERK
ncbi:MAG: alpha-L-fucosidase [Fimbriimonas sp.]